MKWDEDFKEYAVKLARIYQTAPEETIKCLGFGSVAGCLNESYLSLVKEKELLPIENIPENEKVRLWNKAKEISDNKNQCILISRSIYLLEKLT